MMKSKRSVAFLLLFFVCFMLLGSISSQAAVEVTYYFETPKILSCTSTGYNSIELEVEAETGANLHVYRSSSENGSYKLIDSVSLTTGYWWSENGGLYYKTGENKILTCYRKEDKSGYYLDLTDVPFNKKYYYKIRVSTQNSYSKYSNAVSCKTKLAASSITSCYAASDTSATLKWTQVYGAEGYKIFRKTSGSSWKRIKTIKKGNKLTYTDTTVKSGKTYYYRIRAYRKADSEKKYSAYSTKVKVKMSSPKVKGSYSPGSVYGPSLSTTELNEVRQVVQGFKTNYIKSGMSDYDKVLAAYNFLRANCSYAWGGWQYNGANTAWGALVYGEAQCSGFARAMKALCDAVNVDCYYVHASSSSVNPDHQWVMVKVSGKWYIVDAQGGYFLVGSKTWKNLGMRWDSTGLPTCSKKDHKKGGATSSIL